MSTIKGIALKPGVSLNRRLYTPDQILKMAARAEARIRDGQILTMRSHHDAGDDTTRIVGRLTKVGIDASGAATFEAELAPTVHAETIAKLIKGRRFLQGVSICGHWNGKVRTVTGPDGGPCETADDLDLEGVDFTSTPGVPGAGLTERAGRPRRLVLESAEDVILDLATPAELAAMTPADLRLATAAAYGPPAYASSGAAADVADGVGLDGAELRGLPINDLTAYAGGLYALQLRDMEARRPASPFRRGAGH